MNEFEYSCAAQEDYENDTDPTIPAITHIDEKQMNSTVGILSAVEETSDSPILFSPFLLQRIATVSLFGEHHDVELCGSLGLRRLQGGPSSHCQPILIYTRRVKPSIR